MKTLVDLALMLVKLSLLALGSSVTVLGQMETEVVAHGWMTADQFTAAFALSQVTPGPGTLVVIPIGYQAAGFAGAVVALLAFFGPTALLAAGATIIWNRLRESRWAQAVRIAVTPVATGLILASVYTLGRSTIHQWPMLAIGLASFALTWRTKLPVAGVVLGGLAVGAAIGLLAA